MKKPLLLIAAMAFFMFVKAQDPHFSQFFASPLTLNPAFAGKFDGNFRATLNHRQQWASIPNAYVTTSGSVDFGIMKDKIEKGDVLGVGISGLSDQSGDGALKLNYGSVTLSYHKALDEDGYNTIGGGLQATYSSMMIDINKLTFEDQLTANGFTGTTQETFRNGTGVNYIDMNAGLLFSGSTDGTNNYYFGTSFYHLNRPSIGIINQSWVLLPRGTVHGGFTFPLSDILSISASAIEQFQNHANETEVGGAFGANLNNDQDNPVTVYLGSWYRVGDAIIPYAGLEFFGLRIGVSYDVNLSSLKAATAERGGTELSLIYINKTPEAEATPCPKF